MAFEDYLRSIPLVHKHIMRTRLMMHENRQFRKFLETRGINPVDVIERQAEVDGELLTQFADENTHTNLENSFKMVAKSLRDEKDRADELEASLYVLQIDYNELLLKTTRKTGRKKAKTSSPKRSAGQK